jgi:hypothetical protein
MQQRTATISRILNKADIEISPGIPNFMSESVIPITGTIIARLPGVLVGPGTYRVLFGPGGLEINITSQET